VVPSDLYDILIRVLQVEKKINKINRECSHSGYYSLDMLVNQYFDLPTRESNVNIHIDKLN
jgi:hypothetical protein